MIRPSIDYLSSEHRPPTELKRWIQRVMVKDKSLPRNTWFEWKSGDHVGASSSLMFDACMCCLWLAQQDMQQAACQQGREAYRTYNAACSKYRCALDKLHAGLTIRTAYNIPDYMQHDIYGHMCLARARAYEAMHDVAKDRAVSNSVLIKLCNNSAHLFQVASQMIAGDTDSFVQRSKDMSANMYKLMGDYYMDLHKRSDGSRAYAGTAEACYKESGARGLDASDLELSASTSNMLVSASQVSLPSSSDSMYELSVEFPDSWLS